jgi:DNA-binding NarL/FixJ family response regulator
MAGNNIVQRPTARLGASVLNNQPCDARTVAAPGQHHGDRWSLSTAADAQAGEMLAVVDIATRERADNDQGDSVDARTFGSFCGSTDSKCQPAHSVIEGSGLLGEVRMLIVDDCTLYRENLARVLLSHGAASCGTAWDLISLRAAIEDARPRIMLLNISTRNRATLLRQALELGLDLRVIVTGVAGDDEAEIIECAEAGVAGYHMRTDSIDDLLALIRRVAAGEVSCPPRVAELLVRRLSSLAVQRQPATVEPILTTREAQILRMLEVGLSNREIAEQLFIAVHTVKNHVHSLLTKLNVSTRAQAAAYSRNSM